MTDGKPAPAATPSGPIAREFAEWLRAIRKGWTQSVDEPLSCRWRRFYAIAGSSTWLVGFMLVLSARDPRFVNFISANVISVTCAFILLGLTSLWFGWLVAFAERRSGPVRLFLDGLLLPAATVTIIGLSVGQISPVREERRASSESPQDTRSEGPEESSQPPVTFPEIQPEPSESSPDTGGAEDEDDGNEIPN